MSRGGLGEGHPSLWSCRGYGLLDVCHVRNLICLGNEFGGRFVCGDLFCLTSFRENECVLCGGAVSWSMGLVGDSLPGFGTKYFSF